MHISSGGIEVDSGHPEAPLDRAFDAPDALDLG